MRKPSSKTSAWVFIDVVAKAAVEWARDKNYVRALFSYGSYARGDHTPSSDLDLCLLLKPGRTKARLDSLYACLPGKVRWRSDAAGKSVAYLGENLFKIDIIVASSPKDLAWLIDHPDTAAPRLSLLYSKEPGVGRQLSAANRSLSRNSLTLVESEALKFFKYFEACSRSQRRSDSYQHYFNYNLALGTLTRIFHILESKTVPRYLFCPKHTFSNFGGARIEEGKEWTALAGTLYLPEANDAKRRLAEMYRKLMTRARTRFGPKLSPRVMDIRLLEDIMQRDFFFNVRDFAKAYEGNIRLGRLFRTSALPRWKERPELRDFLRTNQIAHIIDLRKPSELAKNGGHLDYDAATLVGINYTNIPVGGGERFGSGGEYMRCLMSNLAQFAYALELIAHAEGNTVIHCHVGKDRTGIACALIASLLDRPRQQIVNDYLLSEQGVPRTKIESLLDDLERAGGAESLLQAVGFDARCKEQLRRKLLR
jgi:protein-tyrosine phosphatase